MGNRRNKFGSRVKRAPADPSGMEGVEPATPPRGRWGWIMITLKVILGTGLILSVVLGIAWGVFRYARTTPRFSVQEIVVEGTKRLSRDDILATAGISLGANLFSVDVESAQLALTKSPWIERAQVTRRLPNTLVVSLRERQAQATLVVAGKSFLIDEDGEPFKEVGSGDPHDLTIITGVTLQALAAERQLEHERLREVLSLIRSYEQLPLAKAYPAEEAHLEASGAVTLTVGVAGIALHLGRPPFKQRLLRAERVLMKAMRQGGSPSVIFLDNEAHPERVVVRVQ